MYVPGRFYVPSKPTRIFIVAEQFKVAFEESQKTNVGLSSTPQGSDPAPVESESEGKEEIKEKEKIREETEATEEANEGTKE